MTNLSDDRYKPVEQPLGNSEQLDDSWYERGELPPVGIECEYKVKVSGQGWVKCFFIGLNSKGNLVIEVFGKYYTYSIEQLDFRPIKSERDQLIEVIVSAGNLSEGCLADAIMAAGFRLTEGKQ